MMYKDKTKKAFYSNIETLIEFILIVDVQLITYHHNVRGDGVSAFLI